MIKCESLLDLKVAMAERVKLRKVLMSRSVSAPKVWIARTPVELGRMYEEARELRGVEEDPLAVGFLEDEEAAGRAGSFDDSRRRRR